ncbi:MAG: hypothetical protein WBL61_18650, partial [Bryobacteraceae bacterium]
NPWDLPLSRRPQNSTLRPRRTLAYCGQKMVLTMGSTIEVVELQIIVARFYVFVKPVDQVGDFS